MSNNENSAENSPYGYAEPGRMMEIRLQVVVDSITHHGEGYEGYTTITYRAADDNPAGISTRPLTIELADYDGLYQNAFITVGYP